VECPVEEQSLLAQTLQLAPDGTTRVVEAKTIDAMKLKIRDCIDEFNQGNRTDPESLCLLVWK
jgi:hypothetical protein